MKEGAEQFFEWCDFNDCHPTITYAPSCGELECKAWILGEGEFYVKRAGNFVNLLDSIKKYYAQLRSND